MRLLPQQFTYDHRMHDPVFAEQHERNVKAGVTEYRRVAPVWPLRNVWLGVSVEDQKWADIRVPALLATPAAVRFLSVEPMLGPVHLRFSQCLTHDFPGGMCTFSCPERTRLHQVIVGGESGVGFRPFDPQWARQVRDDCAAARVAFFFKQHGGRTPKSGGNRLDGRVWAEMPDA
jgi:protein gp37